MKPLLSTIRHLAGNLGLSSATISLALRNQPGVAAATRRRIQAAAVHFGYHANPSVAIASAYARASRPATYKANLAYLCHGRAPGSTATFIGAKATAARRGYGLDLFDLTLEDFHFRRLERILDSRGISAVILDLNGQQHEPLTLDWSRRKAVAIGAVATGPEFHRVDFDTYSDMLMVITKAWLLGYRRLGLMEKAHPGCQIERKIRAAWELAPHVFPEIEFLPPLGESHCSPADLREWHGKYRPEVIISNDWLEVNRCFQSIGIHIPDEIGYIGILKTQATCSASGVFQGAGMLGAAAADLLVEIIELGDTGNPKLLLSRGEWRDGTTLPRCGPAPKASLPRWLTASQAMCRDSMQVAS